MQEEEKILASLSRITNISIDNKLMIIKYCKNSKVKWNIDKNGQIVYISFDWSIPSDIAENEFLAVCYVVLSMMYTNYSYKPEIFNSLRAGEFKIFPTGFGRQVVLEYNL
jgi:hypothetical protein